MQPIDQVIEQTAATFACARADMLSRSRRRSVVFARQAAMWAVRQRYPSIPLDLIGQTIGGRHYTTVMYAIAAAERRAQSNTWYRAQLAHILERLAPRTPRSPDLVVDTNPIASQQTAASR